MLFMRRWSLVVSEDTDQSVRVYLASKGARKGDLSRFIEEAVRAHLFDLAAKQAKEANADISEDDLASIIKEAVDWARR